VWNWYEIRLVGQQQASSIPRPRPLIDTAVSDSISPAPHRQPVLLCLLDVWNQIQFSRHASLGIYTDAREKYGHGDDGAKELHAD
jgi:hypothetical protein